MSVTKFSQLDLTKRYSYADYLTWQFKERVELIKGWIYKMSTSPSFEHQHCSSHIFGHLYPLFSKTEKSQLYSAPFDVRLFDNKKSTSDKAIYTVVQPDLLVVCDPDQIDNRGVIGPPNLIVEILSPGNSKREMKEKYELYELNKVPEYWVVNPSMRDMHQFILHDGKYVLNKIYFDDDVVKSPQFKKIKLPLSKVFR